MKAIWIGLSVLILVGGCSSETTETGELLENLSGDTILSGGEPRIPGISVEDTVSGTTEDTAEVAGGEEGGDVGPVGNTDCNGACAPELCDPQTNTCYECNNQYDCDYASGEWCDGHTCVKTLCVPGTKECLDDTTAAVCFDDGSAWDETPCEGNAFCAYGECKEKVCEPGATECSYYQQKVCDGSGTSWGYVPCPPGLACLDDSCQAVKNNVVVVMDTSGSMFSLSAGGGFPGLPNIPLDAVTCVCGQGNCTEQPFPACEDVNCPISKLGLAKYTLNQLIEGGEFDAANVSLMRFPQGITSSPNLECGLNLDPFGGGEKQGYYVGGNMYLSGDNGQHITIAGDYFEYSLYESLSVPFPVTSEDDSVAELGSWMDGDEVFGPTTTPCTTNGDCPGGYCDDNGGTNVCHQHSNPELRAMGGTPLGPSLFYAGEYIRRYILMDGKLCETDADCQNVNYFCNPDNGRCFDPLRSCRQTAVVLFSDGVGEAQDDAFFEPENVTKRLRYGLGCSDDSQCHSGSSCTNGSCQGYPLKELCGGQAPEECGQSINYTDFNENVQQLYAYDGSALQVTTHAIYIHGPGEGDGATQNQLIADHGGGLFFDVATDDPSGLLEAINSILDIKENIAECVPFLPESLKN